MYYGDDDDDDDVDDDDDNDDDVVDVDNDDDAKTWEYDLCCVFAETIGCLASESSPVGREPWLIIQKSCVGWGVHRLEKIRIRKISTFPVMIVMVMIWMMIMNTDKDDEPGLLTLITLSRSSWNDKY